MKTKHQQIAEAISSNIIDYFANSITASCLIRQFIRPIISVSDEQEREISDILAEANGYWLSADCEAEGANEQENKELDRIIDDCANRIATLISPAV